MTTHDHPTLTGSDPESQAPQSGTGPVGEHTTRTAANPTTVSGEPSPPLGAPAPFGQEQNQNQPPVTPADPSTAPGETAPTGEAAAVPAGHSGEEAESPTKPSLFADEELGDLRARWAAVQAAFVDDPKECVHKADHLVSDLVEQLTTGFAHARSRLEEQWARGEEASTEDLRLALMHYREFFERLLAV
ncbi:hypothetical protein [Mycobacterium sp. 852002-51057_SCH5723018]|uniref:hypothetical protein n=1 Tax=Mycobacterium sp. 852002-51057_SCH5723018 TaxID=1834094 RepID=UPI0007FFFC7F|nr:hypothetical protein [Mycobacterium sp. 852002-51057_SCH5723018]OBG24206.1 hypothetical protein A5764_00915 [Mycobacterium sp. 852002-51057_SCH5723018]